MYLTTKVSRGFTLIELMITVAILAIVMSIAVPSFRDVIQENRAATTANELISAMSLARSEAIARNTAVTVCRRKANSSECENGTNWGTGWLVAAGATTIKLWDPPVGTPTITVNGTTNNVEFTASGIRSVLTTTTICLTLPKTSGTATRRITVTPGGAHYAQNISCP